MNFKFIIITFILSSVLSCSSNTNKTLKDKTDVKNIDSYTEGQKEFHKKNYEKALFLFKYYIEKNKTAENKEKLLWAIDQIGRIYLRGYKTPAIAVSFFEKVLAEIKFNDADGDTLLEWSTVSKRWNEMGKMPNTIKGAKELFSLGEKYYQRGMDKLDYPADNTGNADLHIAATYLIPYVYNFEDGKHIGRALFMLGNIRFRSWNDYEYLSENFYLKEVIKRAPHTDLARKAFKVLKEGIHAGYSGSGGDFTPPSQLKMLKEFENLARAK
jgi:hypothetical protein